MTAVILVGLMVALALVLAITWIEPRILGGPVTAGPRRAEAANRPIEPVRSLDSRSDMRADGRPQSRPAPRSEAASETSAAPGSHQESARAA